jgi:(S)-2-hydroxyglutarate dehydrogenase
MNYDIAIVGGGIVGLATAHALLRQFPECTLAVIEKESQLAQHQSGRNSGVIHSGVYYQKGSLKAKLCVEGGRLLSQFCEERSIPSKRCGKVIVAEDSSQVPALDRLYQQGLQNGVGKISFIGPEHLHEIEPHVKGVKAIHLPDISIIDFAVVAQALATEVEKKKGTIHLGTKLLGLKDEKTGWQLLTSQGDLNARFLINCAGLHVDRIGWLALDQPPVDIIPFRGEYFHLPRERTALVHGLVYPVPDPAMPFLGVHFTKTLDGGVHVGPNAVLALKREGYRLKDVSLKDCVALLTQRSFWKMAKKYWRVGLDETARSLSKHKFLKEAQRLLPDLRISDLIPAPSGVRAQAIDHEGTLLHDFVLHETPRALHVYNAPSPAATASLSIGRTIASSEAIAKKLG